MRGDINWIFAFEFHCIETVAPDFAPLDNAGGPRIAIEVSKGSRSDSLGKLSLLWVSWFSALKIVRR